MKTLFTILGLLVAIAICAQPLNQTYTNADGYTNILGQFEVSMLTQEPFAGWYAESQNKFESVKADLSAFDSVTVFMATWCGDSRREVPAFVKLLEENHFDMTKVKFVGLNYGLGNYKKSPGGEQRGQNIHRVPTFLFHDQSGDEIGRLVESPVESWEADLKQISLGKYEPNYPVVNRLHELISQGQLEKSQLKELAKALKGQSDSQYELRNYGFKLVSDFRIPDAELVFHLNSLMYPEEAQAHYYLGWAHELLGEDKAAKGCYKKSVALEPENETYTEKLALITSVK